MNLVTWMAGFGGGKTVVRARERKWNTPALGPPPHTYENFIVSNKLSQNQPHKLTVAHTVSEPICTNIQNGI